MKKLFFISLVFLFAVPALATTRRTPTRAYEKPSDSPVLGTQMGQDAEMLEAEETESYSHPLTTREINENRRLQQQEMEERNNSSSTIIDKEEAVIYKDRTRTDRERKALNTSSNASDDQ
jgi:hypothetical protein